MQTFAREEQMVQQHCMHCKIMRQLVSHCLIVHTVMASYQLVEEVVMLKETYQQTDDKRLMRQETPTFGRGDVQQVHWQLIDHA